MLFKSSLASSLSPVNISVKSSAATADADTNKSVSPVASATATPTCTASTESANSATFWDISWILESGSPTRCSSSMNSLW